MVGTGDPLVDSKHLFGKRQGLGVLTGHPVETAEIAASLNSVGVVRAKHGPLSVEHVRSQAYRLVKRP